MRRDYLELISAYEQLPAPAELAALPGPEALRRQVELVASYRTLPFRDPDLPAALLPRGVARAARAFARQLRPGPPGRRGGLRRMVEQLPGLAHRLRRGLVLVGAQPDAAPGHHPGHQSAPVRLGRPRTVGPAGPGLARC